MIQAGQICCKDYPFLKQSDTHAFALDLMAQNNVCHLPVLNQDLHIAGFLSLEEALEVKDKKTKVTVGKADVKEVAAIHSAPLAEVIFKMRSNNLTLLPVIDDDLTLLGSITQNEIVKYFSDSTLIEQSGGTVVLEMGYYDYSLAEIARIAENNNMQIMAAYVSKPSDALNINVTIKLNHTDLTRFVADLERYNYHILYKNHHSNLGDLYQERLDSLLNYLNI